MIFPESPPALSSASAPVAESERPRVLLVDDQPARLLTYESVLEGVGVACVRALSGREALEHLLQQEFAVILLDVSMPEMDGFETARLIRDHRRFERTPIIFVTGVHVSELDALRGYEAGAIDYISVPLVPEILRSKVALLVELYRRRRQLEGLNRDLERARTALESERAKNLAAVRRDLDRYELQYRAIFEHPLELTIVLEAERSPEGAVLDWRYVDANQNALRFLDHERDTLIGRRLSEIVPDRAARLTELYARVLRERTPHQYESWFAGTDLLVCLFPMGDSTIVSSALDITARKRAESEAQRLLEAHRAADRRKDEFIAMLAHELRNPLVPIRTGIELLRSACERPDILETVRPMMERQVAHMVRLIDDLLDVSRITSGRIELRRQPVTLSSLVGTAVEANSAAIRAAGLDVTVNLSEPQWVLNVDPTRLTQVISNLVQNAVKFSPRGGRIDIRATIETAGSARTPELILTVTDAGIGIAESMLPRVFELFWQAEPGARSSQSGLGVGLAIARRLVEMHGGSIAVRSEGTGCGSEFTIRLPAPRDVLGAQAAGAENRPTLAALKVLVVDDNRDAADVMAVLLRSLGSQVQVAYDGLQAIASIDESRPDLVLLDIGMPGMDGHETCRRIRAQHGARIKLIAVSGWGQEQDKQAACEAGFDAHLTKPVEAERLEGLILGLSRNKNKVK